MSMWTAEIQLLPTATHATFGEPGYRRDVMIDCHHKLLMEVTVAILYPAGIDNRGVQLIMRHDEDDSGEICDPIVWPPTAGASEMRTTTCEFEHHAQMLVGIENLSRNRAVVIAATYRMKYDLHDTG